MGPVLTALTKVLNPVAARVASRGLIPVWGLVIHTGRRSGKRYVTPIAIVRTDEGFIIPLPWGPGTDWCRNVVAARGGVVRWGGVDHEVGEPEIVDQATAAPSFPMVPRVALGLFGIKRFVRVRRVTSSSEPGGIRTHDQGIKSPLLYR